MGFRNNNDHTDKLQGGIVSGTEGWLVGSHDREEFSLDGNKGAARLRDLGLCQMNGVSKSR
jgi:hypothetical protein